MALSGIDDLDGELAQVRALRSDPPGLASSGKRREVFGAALEQFEQLLMSAYHVGPASAPLPLFYALSQAGRAIAAARMRTSTRWAYRGHGLGQSGAIPKKVGNLKVEPRPRKQNDDAFGVVCDAVDSPRLAAPVALRDLWASLPDLATAEDLGGASSSARPLYISPHRDYTTNQPTTLGSVEIDEQALRKAAPRETKGIKLDGDAIRHDEQVKRAWQRAFDRFMVRYPAASGIKWTTYTVVSGTEAEVPRHGVLRVYVSWPGNDGILRPLQECAEPLNFGYWLRPAVERKGQKPPSILMTWWATLLGLSLLARYAPATWTAALQPDSSSLAVPIEQGLAHARAILPRLVYDGITGSWGREG